MCRLQMLSCPSCLVNRPVPLLTGNEEESQYHVVQDVECSQFYCRWQLWVHTYFLSLPNVSTGQNVRVDGVGCGYPHCHVNDCRVIAVWRECATCRLRHRRPLYPPVRKIVTPWRDPVYHFEYQL